jgi:hypothetical protein
MKTSHLVIAHYKEDLDWTNNIAIPFTIITKGKYFKETPPNRGNEASSYLEYIIKNYDNLSDFTIFVHGHRSSWHHKNNIDDTINNIRLEYDYVNINDEELYDYTKPTSGAELAFIRVLPIVNQILNYNEPVNINYKDLRFKLAAQFCVKRENIRRHPITVYQQLYQYLMISPYGSNWTGTAYEYLWHYIFTGNLVDKCVIFIR